MTYYQIDLSRLPLILAVLASKSHISRFTLSSTSSNSVRFTAYTQGFLHIVVGKSSRVKRQFEVILRLTIPLSGIVTGIPHILYNRG